MKEKIQKEIKKITNSPGMGSKIYQQTRSKKKNKKKAREEKSIEIIVKEIE